MDQVEPPVGLLGPLDRVGVVAFDENASWLVPLQEAADRAEIAQLVGGLQAGGGTDIYAGVLAVSQVFPDVLVILDDQYFMHEPDFYLTVKIRKCLLSEWNFNKEAGSFIFCAFK